MMSTRASHAVFETPIRIFAGGGEEPLSLFTSCLEKYYENGEDDVLSPLFRHANHHNDDEDLSFERQGKRGGKGKSPDVKINYDAVSQAVAPAEVKAAQVKIAAKAGIAAPRQGR